MDRFLKESSRAGQFDSRGQFTVAGQKALAKLAEHSLTRPEHWILKMVQAAVAGLSERLEVKQTRTEIALRFWFPTAPSFVEVADALLELDKPALPFLGEMAIGLRALLKSRKFEVCWSQGPSLRWTGANLEEGTRNARASSFEIVVAYSPGWLSGGAEERAGETQIVHSRAVYCPIPLLWDSREVSVLDIEPTALKSDTTKFFHLACGYLSEPQRESELIEVTRRKDPLQGKAPLVRWPRAPGSVGSFSFYLVGGGYVDAPFRKIWTRYGVACAETVFPAAMGGFLQLPGEHLRSDLTGLSLELSQKESRAWPVGRLRSHGLAAIADLERLPSKATYAEMAANLGVGVAALCLGTACSLVNVFTLGLARPDFNPDHVAASLRRSSLSPWPDLLKRRLEALLVTGATLPTPPSRTRSRRSRR